LVGCEDIAALLGVVPPSGLPDPRREQASHLVLLGPSLPSFNPCAERAAGLPSCGALL